MSSRAQHYREAERILEGLPELPAKPDHLDLERRIFAIGEARAHAMLASIPNEVYNEYLDLLSLEQMREEVVNVPSADSRDWLAEDEPRCEHCGVVGGGHTFECIAGSR